MRTGKNSLPALALRQKPVWRCVTGKQMLSLISLLILQVEI